MSWTRLAAVLTAGGALLLAPQALPASASTSGPASASSSGPASAPHVAAVTAVVAKPLIQGVVTDQFGRPVDDVKVQAVGADGTREASALTYASSRPRGPQHGYFFLEVRRGTYTLTLSRSGYVTRKLSRIKVTQRGQRVDLHEIAIHKRLPASRTRGALEEKVVTTKRHAQAVVVVAGAKRPTGDVEVREGRRVVGEAALTSRDKGSLTVRLDKLARGRHDLKAYYLGSRVLEPSGSKGFTLTVTKPRH